MTTNVATALPPLHVGRPNIASRERFLHRVNEILDRRWLTNNGECVHAFETEIASMLGVRHCVAMCNGTIALEIAIRALNLNGEVIVPSFTFIATAHALYWQGIMPVFADIDPLTHNLDPESVRRSITARTTGIIGVHLWGRPAPVDELNQIAQEHRLSLMFDAAHAFGCTRKGRFIGQFGECEVLSFHATKVLNTFEGGAVLTNNDELAEKARLMRNFGFSEYDKVIYPGTNGKMPEICAAMGLANLEEFSLFVAANRRNYDAYRAAFAEIPGLSLIHYDEGERNNYHYIVIEIGTEFPRSRDEVIAELHASNILARKYFWPGCHQMLPYRDICAGSDRHLPSTRMLASRVIVLPNGSATNERDICRVIDAILKICKR